MLCCQRYVPRALPECVSSAIMSTRIDGAPDPVLFFACIDHLCRSTKPKDGVNIMVAFSMDGYAWTKASSPLYLAGESLPAALWCGWQHDGQRPLPGAHAAVTRRRSL